MCDGLCVFGFTVREPGMRERVMEIKREGGSREEVGWRTKRQRARLESGKILGAC